MHVFNISIILLFAALVNRKNRKNALNSACIYKCRLCTDSPASEPQGLVTVVSELCSCYSLTIHPPEQLGLQDCLTAYPQLLFVHTHYILCTLYI